MRPFVAHTDMSKMEPCLPCFSTVDHQCLQNVQATVFVSKGGTLRLSIDDVAFNSALARAIAYGFAGAERIGGASH